jgi:hypothetical protein
MNKAQGSAMYTALYKPGNDLIDGVKATCKIVRDVEIEANLADGWVKTLAELSEHAKPETVPDTVPETVTREEMEKQAEALGVKIDRRWSDKRLIEEIAKAGQ